MIYRTTQSSKDSFSVLIDLIKLALPVHSSHHAIALPVGLYESSDFSQKLCAARIGLVSSLLLSLTNLHKQIEYNYEKHFLQNCKNLMNQTFAE